MTAREATIMAHQWCRLMYVRKGWRYVSHDTRSVVYDTPGFYSGVISWEKVREQLRAEGFNTYA